MPPAEGAGWLRRYVHAWDFSPEAPPMDAPALRRQAERDFTAAGNPWDGRLAQVVATLDRPRSAYGAWVDAVSKADAALVPLAEGGLLTNDPRRILASQLHMLHDRLGLSIAQERYLCWLTSLILLRDGGPAFYGAAATGLERGYHEHSKYVPGLMERAQLPDRTVPAPTREAERTGAQVTLSGVDDLLPVVLYLLPVGATG